jgi:hypothetical protein
MFARRTAVRLLRSVEDNIAGMRIRQAAKFLDLHTRAEEIQKELEEKEDKLVVPHLYSIADCVARCMDNAVGYKYEGSDVYLIRGIKAVVHTPYRYGGSKLRDRHWNKLQEILEAADYRVSRDVKKGNDIPAFIIEESWSLLRADYKYRCYRCGPDPYFADSSTTAKFIVTL